MKTTETHFLSPLGVLILGWLLGHAEGGTASKIETGIGPLLQLWRSTKAERLQVITAEISLLVKAGLLKSVRRASYQLTPNGKVEILKALQLSSLPKSADWRTLKIRIFLVFIVMLMTALLNGVQAAPPPPEKKLLPLPKDDSTFAQRVLSAARGSKSGRFGENKVFVSHVIRQLEGEGFAIGDVNAFKERLVAAHRGKLLALSRADLVQAMAPADVEDSEIGHLNGTFHFVRI
ncbi:hypothetical protein [Polyangium fumosum]|uniref:Uncharacterized protein n=1 Tax=Polyangium fumosum TaxID=889272 RepID=A0A4U1J817_9BACT|nr:hypothetical protein [Polyangium fumosum]TKD03364.1 hypothetical protein E8A74_25680 [Polyangium fumosum]